MSRAWAEAGVLPIATAFGAALLVAADASTAGGGDAAPPCGVTVTLEPDRAVVGQQVLYRVEILTVDDVGAVTWLEPPSFPAMRTERLSGSPVPGRVARAGVSYRRQEERFALFPERAGAHALHAPDMRCAVAPGGEAFLARVPDTHLRVAPLPEKGRPRSFDGLVGPLSLGVTVTPLEMRVGESVRVALMLRGGGNLWDAAAPFDTGSFGDAEVFALRPSLALERGRVLYVRRHYGYDVVPREAGPLIVPEVRVPYFDPERQTYAVATSDEIVVRVDPREVGGGDIPEGEHILSAAQPPAAHESPGVGIRASSVFAWLAGLVALLALSLAVARRLRRRRTTGTTEALERAAQAQRNGDAEGEAAALATALRLALAHEVPDARNVSPEELCERERQPARVQQAALLLLALERSRFDPAAQPPDAAAVLRAIDGLN